jgi:hypothetical protein
MLLLVLYQWIGRDRLIASSQSPQLAGAFYDAFTGSVDTLVWTVFGIGILAAVSGFLASYVSARRVKR